MNIRRRERGTFASPVLIGAVTVLVAIVAVFLAYNANNGLPFVPRYSVQVQVGRRGGADPGRRGPPGGRSAGRARHQHRSGARRSGRADRGAQSGAQQERGAAVGELDLEDPPEGRDRAEVPPADPGRLQADDSRRRNRARSPRRAPRSTSIRCSPSTARPPGRRSRRPRPVTARRWPDGGSRSTTRSARSCRWSTTSARWRATCPPSTPTSPGSSTASRASRRRLRPSPSSRRTCTRTWPPRSRRRRASRCRSSRTGSARPRRPCRR